MKERDRVKENLHRLWCQHCKALQKVNDTVVECWYNPLEEGVSAYCSANIDAVEYVLSRPEIAVLADDQSLPDVPYTTESGLFIQGKVVDDSAFIGYLEAQQDMLKAGSRRVV